MHKHSLIFPAGLLLGVAMTAPEVSASHFRGGALVPEVTAGGVLKVEGTSFWRPTGLDNLRLTVVGSVSGTIASSIAAPNNYDAADSRFTVNRQTWNVNVSTLPAQTFTVEWNSCCRVAGIINMPGSSGNGNSLRSTIVWDGTSATKPIDFNFSAIQSEVGRNAAYSDNVGAVSPSGNTISYAQTTPQQSFVDIAPFSQPPGFTLDASTGNMSIPAVNTATYLDNGSNAGADYAFAGNVIAKSGATEVGRVQFDWLFDAVDTGPAVNNAPTVVDAVVNALVGDTVVHTFTGVDPDGDPLTWVFLGQLGSVPAIAPTFNPATREYTWDTTGSLPGVYIAQVRASDGSLTDVGGLTINLSLPSTGVPDGGSPAFLLGIGTLGLLTLRQRASKLLAR